MRPAETLKPRVFVSSGSDGCHLFSSEPEDESASVGACGGIQFSPETQHEETHLNGHVDPCFSPTSFDLTLSDSYANKKKQKVRAHPQPQVLASQNYCLPGFLFKKKKKNLFIWNTGTSAITHTHTQDEVALQKSAEDEQRNLVSVTAGETDLYLFPQLLICTYPPRLSFFLPFYVRKKRTSWCFPSLWLAD